jgi:hypothetical protein
MLEPERGELSGKLSEELTIRFVILYELKLCSLQCKVVGGLQSMNLKAFDRK